MANKKKKILITMGDPSGIGPEVTLKALASPEIRGLADFLVIGETSGDRGVRSGRASLEYIDRAIELLRQGKAKALVTAPVNKELIRKSGAKHFQGHTEYLAERFGVKKFAMLFVGHPLKVSLVTRHLALKDVPRALKPEMIYNTIVLTLDSLKKQFKVRSPKIAVCGLNPHAGEGGSFGDEEKRIISPAIKKALAISKNIYGPLPADVVFHYALKGKYDAVVAIYHDQALAPFKTLYFEDGVNMTIGLPFIRTSPDHGTAFDIAGKGIADPSSMIAAIKLAARIS